MLKNYLAISKHVDSIKTSIIFFICGITALFSQQPPVLLSSVDTTTIKIGEQINYQIKINSDSISNIVFEKNQIFNPFEVIEEFEIDTFKKSGRTSFIKKFSITSFDAGVQILKPKKILVDDELRIFYLSNLMKEKGIICLLKALKNLEGSNIKYKAKIAGNIDEKFSNEILKLINELEHTDYLGVVYGEAKKNLLAWGNVFVLPTFYKMEGQPISILEAMATKNVVVTTNHAGILDFFKDKVNGFLVQKNNIKSIQDILTYIAQNKSEIKKIATYNKGYFLENFTVNSFKENFIKIIN